MKVPLSWLRDYVKIELLAKELAHRLTMSGTEVASLTRTGADLENVFVAKLVAVGPHPNADRLRLATVDLGGEQITVVCGAPNLHLGNKIAFAKVGARLLDGHTGEPTVVKAATIRGVASEGMVCSEKELGLSEEHEGILVLPDHLPVGVPLAEVYGDTILDLEITPNRPDCLSMLGIAREVAALTGQQVSLPDSAYSESGPPITSDVSVEIAAPDLCPRYCATLIRGVTIGPSPAWMQERLLAAGMRPINNVVDVTNYVMLEYGQPLHAFDLDKVRGRKIIVRRAKPGERLRTLDGTDRDLTTEMLLIADAEGPVATGGVMGGASSEVTESTVNVLLESANFNHISIRRTSARLKVRTEASLRFDKGLSPELPLYGLKRATKLIAELAGGAVAPGVIDVYPGKTDRSPIRFGGSEVKRILGIDIEAPRIQHILESLGFQCSPVRGDPEELDVSVPYWRTDVRLTDDLVEEVARIIGYEAIPSSVLRGELPPFVESPLQRLRERLRDILVGLGLQETISYPLISLTALESAGALSGALPKPTRLANPMSAEQEYLRTTMRASLLLTLASNLRHEETGIRLFELGKVYLARDDDLPEEQEVAAGILWGRREELTWLSREGDHDLFDVKGLLEGVFSRLSIATAYSPTSDDFFLPGRAAQAIVEDTPIAVFGAVHPAMLERFDIEEGPVFYFELELAKLLPFFGKLSHYQPLPRYPGVHRDLALVVDREIPASRVQHILAASPYVAQASLFDVYSGKPVPAGKKSLAFALLYQAEDRTLTDQEVDRIHQSLLDRLRRELGAELRT